MTTTPNLPIPAGALDVCCHGGECSRHARGILTARAPRRRVSWKVRKGRRPCFVTWIFSGKEIFSAKTSPALPLWEQRQPIQMPVNPAPRR
jgi:hypothetical protein